MSLEYKLPALSAWVDMILLGEFEQRPSAVFIELKDWTTKGDLPGSYEGLMIRHGQSVGHPSDQVKGYVEQSRFHSAIESSKARVHGCVIFTNDRFFHTYRLAPNENLTRAFPCFSVNGDDVSNGLPEYFRQRLTTTNHSFARAFMNGVYAQSRGFVQLIGEQLLNPASSPFVLLGNQRVAFATVKASVVKVATAKRPKKTVILIEGPPGSGKSAVAAKVWASLVTDKNTAAGNVVISTTSASQSSNWRHLFNRAAQNQAGQGAVVKATGYTPITTGEFGELRKKYRDAFRKEAHWRDNLAMLRSIKPEFRSGSRDDEFLVSIVDEAHALINPEYAEGRGQFGFTTALGPQAYHIMRASVITVFLLDPDQGFRDRENTTIGDIRKWADELGAVDFEELSLAGSQFRCAGSKEYTDWVDELLGFKTTTVTKHKRDFAPLEIGMCDGPSAVEEALRTKADQGFVVRLLASYARKWVTEKRALPHQVEPHAMDFHEPYIIDGQRRYWSKIWNYVPRGNDYTHFIQAPRGSKMFDDPLCEVGCPYAVRGFDFGYVGLLWFSDLKWRESRWVVDLNHVYERGIARRIKAARAEGTADGPAHRDVLRAVAEAYRIVLTRPLKGIFIWCEDDETREHLRTAVPWT